MNGPALSAGAEASVRQLIANGKYKIAVDTAKEIHKAQPTAASEALLVDAYAARIQSLLDQNLELEAKSLLELVRDRYPSARDRFKAGAGAAGVHASLLEELVGPLNDRELSADRRGAIEAAVAREGDIAALADCAVLPAEHPLRQAAMALHRAFLAVTEGPVGEEAVDLPEVSHRSPLAPWKLLVRAIACFYRGEDEACRRYLEAIQPEAAPARLVPAMQAMLGGKPAGLTAAAAVLVSSTTSDPGELRKPLEALEKAFGPHNNGAILKAIREAVQACRAAAPDQLERLKQHIAVRCSVADIAVGKAEAAMGGPPRGDAGFLRLFARALEETGDPESIAKSCSVWEEFRKMAVSEGWFKANSPEAATLYLHMAGKLQKVPLELLEELREALGRKNKWSGEELYYLYPEKLYGRACALDPHFESFSQWMDWAKRSRAGQAEKVAEAWHKTRPMDIEPILLLMEEKEKRSAFHTSLQLLAKAEQIDSVHPAVRRARLRLLAGSVLRYLQQKKPHLAEEKLAEMETLPQSQQGDRPAFLAALRYMLWAVRGSRDAAAPYSAEVERLLGSRAAAALLIFGMANTLKQDALEQLPALELLPKSERTGLPEAVIRVVELAKDMQVSQEIPGGWLIETFKQLPRAGQSLSVSQLRTLGEAGLDGKHFELAYAVAGIGLERGGPTEADFLLLRARSLRKDLEGRYAVCAAAAAQLGRQQRQMEVVEKAVELIADSPFDDLKFTPEQTSTVIKKEKGARAFPTPYDRGPDYGDLLEGECMCPNCRRQRGEAVSPFEDFDDNDDDPDFDEILDEMPLPPGIPPELAKMFLEEARKAVERGEPLDSMLNRLFGENMGPGGRRKKGRRR